MDPHPPQGVDITTPSQARVYDYVLGGTQNYVEDRRMADEYLEHFPEVRPLPLHNRAFTVRAVRHLAAEVGIDQFLDLGSGLPTQQNVHQVAQAHREDARVVYVDRDPIVLAHSRALLADDAHTTYIDADIRYPETILGHPDTHALIDFSRPVALLLVSVLHYIADEDDPAGVTARIVAALPPGSRVVIAHVTTEGADGALLERQRQLFSGGQYPRSAAQIEAMFAGLPLAHGLADVQLVLPDETSGEPGPLRILAGIARVD